MAITGMQLSVMTQFHDGAGTDGDVYLGLAGREFYVDSFGNDFEWGRGHTYQFGVSVAEGEVAGDGRLTYPQWNNPRNPPLDEWDVVKNPIYLRFVPRSTPYGPDRNDNWDLKVATLTIQGDFEVAGFFPVWHAIAPISLGIRRGLQVAFRPELPPVVD